MTIGLEFSDNNFDIDLTGELDQKKRETAAFLADLLTPRAGSHPAQIQEGHIRRELAPDANIGFLMQQIAKIDHSS